MPDLSPIIQKLKQLRDTVDFNKNLEVFNNDNRNADLFDVVSHRYQLGPCLSEAEVSAFEARHSLSLPADYRAFLLEVGDGGAGPYYGLYSLAKALTIVQRKVGNPPDVLSRPFPHAEPYLHPVDADDDVLEAFYSEVYDPQHVHGTLPLADFGCGIDALLVVNGAAHGTLWLDDRYSENGVWPLYVINGVVDFTPDLFLEADEDEDTVAHCSFAEWYAGWLDERLKIHADYQRGAWEPYWTEARRNSDAGTNSLLFRGNSDD